MANWPPDTRLPVTVKPNLWRPHAQKTKDYVGDVAPLVTPLPSADGPTRRDSDRRNESA